MTIGDRVKTLRESKGMTQEELANRLGKKSKSSVAHIEKGKRDIPRSMVVQLAEILDTTPAYLMGWTDKKESTPTDSNGRSAIVEKINSLSDSQLDKLSGYLDALIDK